MKRLRIIFLVPWALVSTAGAQSPLPDAFSPAANAAVFAMAVQSDGKIVAGGSFTSVAGQPRNRIVRLSTDGTLDSGFNPAANDTVFSVAVQPDGRILVAGLFTTLGGLTRNYVGRLNADGTLDAGFNPGASSSVNSLAVQRDGKILVGGQFTTLAGQTRPYLARLNSDGTLDADFNPAVSNSVYALAIQADGKILTGGQFTGVGGATRNNLARLNNDGTLDSAFDPNANSRVMVVALQADGKILVGGRFTQVAGQTRNRIARLDDAGILDTGFNPGAGNAVSSLAVQADGKILAGGQFTTMGGQTRNRLARLTGDGTLDPGFDPGADNVVNALAVQADGKVLIGGLFAILGGQARNDIGRLSATDPATETLAFDASSITWLRGGTSPELGSTGFEASTNGLDTITLGAGTRISGGWRVSGLSLPTNATIRARGFVAGGYLNGSSWFLQTMIGAPVLAAQSFSRTNDAGTTALFSVTAIGAEPLGYQWLKDGVALADGGNITGSLAATLSVSNLLKTDEGSYRVVITNSEGSVTGALAVLRVNDPAITSQPVSQNKKYGDSANLSVTAVGTAPLNYQWWKDGILLSQASGTNLALSKLQGSDAGFYTAVVSNSEGSMTSLVATLTVIDPLITNQPVSQYKQVGASAAFSVAAVGTPPLSYQWWKDGMALTQRTGATLTLTNLEGGDTGRYTVVVSNSYSSITSAVALLAVNLATPDAMFNSAQDASGPALAVQADGQVLLGGYFTNVDGQTRNYIARLNSDGTLDQGFNPSADDYVTSLALQPDGKIVAAGLFTTLGGTTHSYLARLNANGTLDDAFNPGPDIWVIVTALQPDGKIVAGGYFRTMGGQPRNSVARLNADGTLDSQFNPNVDYQVYSLALQADGQILVGGNFNHVGGQNRNLLARLNSDGTLDQGFNPVPANGGTLVSALALQADGKILVGGVFTVLGGQPRNGLGRLNVDGTIDAGFNPSSGLGDGAKFFAVQSDGKVLTAGYFTLPGAPPAYRLVRLNSDGTLDLSFYPGENGSVGSLALQPDGKILLTGLFTSVGGQTRNHAARLDNGEPGIDLLGYDGSTVTWLRSGTRPEVWRTTLDASIGGVDWTSLGPGARTANGWQWTQVSAPPKALLRARGFVGGAGNSDWFVENLLPTDQTAPEILTHDGIFGVTSNRFGFNIQALAGQVVVVEGSSNLVHWTSLYTNTMSSEGNYFSEAGWDQMLHRYYRARLWK